jgi:hypothetical protein
VKPDGRLEGDPAALAALADDGVRTVADVLARAECVRDLPRRSNHVLTAGGLVLHVKRTKSRRPSAEAAAIRAAAQAGVPVPRIAFEGVDAKHGAVVGTHDLAPARPLDDLLAEGALVPDAAREALAALARAAAGLHGARLHHHDLYLNHVWVDPSARPATVTLIDLERLTRGHGVLGRTVVKDLAAIEASFPPGVLPCRARARFLRVYLDARGFPARLLLGPLLHRVVKKSASIRRHVPRTPVGDAARPSPEARR